MVILGEFLGVLGTWVVIHAGFSGSFGDPCGHFLGSGSFGDSGGHFSVLRGGFGIRVVASLVFFACVGGPGDHFPWVVDAMCCYQWSQWVASVAPTFVMWHEFASVRLGPSLGALDPETRRVKRTSVDGCVAGY